MLNSNSKKSLIQLISILVLAFLLLIVMIYQNYLTNNLEIKYDRQLSDLMSSAYKLSEESFHTQLELWEYAYDPTMERLEHFKAHEDELKRRYKSFYQSSLLQKEGLDPKAVTNLVNIFEYYKNIWVGWDNIISTYLKNGNKQQFRASMFKLEKYFDDSQINIELNKIIEGHAFQISQVRNTLNKKAYTRFVFSVVILTLLLVTAIFYILRTQKREKLRFVQLVQTEKMATLGQMSASMAHEMNTPLMFIQGFSSRIRSTIKKNGQETEELNEYLTDIDEGIERMSQIVNHLRNFTRESKNEKKVLDLNSVIKRAFVLFNEQLKNCKIHYVMNFSDDKALVYGDANRIEQSIINFISNSRDALMSIANKNDKIIKVTSYVENKNIVIIFEDNGSGINAKNIDKIFDPFFTTKAAGLGTGLGLPIVNEIIIEHKGTIEVSSELGKGTKFLIKLPLYSEGM
jgi:C4-dicarboxylate-specific signal transduction histidine kinase